MTWAPRVLITLAVKSRVTSDQACISQLRLWTPTASNVQVPLAGLSEGGWNLRRWAEPQLIGVFLRGWLGYAHIEKETHRLKVGGQAGVRNREITCHDPRADGEQKSKLRVRSQVTPRPLRAWKGPPRRACCCRLAARFHGLAGQSGWPRGKGHNKHEPCFPPSPSKLINPLTAWKDQCRPPSRWSGGV